MHESQFLGVCNSYTEEFSSFVRKALPIAIIKPSLHRSGDLFIEIFYLERVTSVSLSPKELKKLPASFVAERVIHQLQ